jgi:small subunit ribosomal protein S4
MGRYVGPNCRLCRAEEVKLYLKGERCKSDKCPISKRRSKPGRSMRARTRKVSDYGLQLREKQKVKRMYGMLEKQFRLFFEKASRAKGITGEALIIMLERRLDNMVYRMHFAGSRKQARQLVSHGHVHVNGRRVTIPSYLVRERAQRVLPLGGRALAGGGCRPHVGEGQGPPAAGRHHRSGGRAGAADRRALL